MTKTEVYVNPANGHTEDAYGAGLFTLLFGMFYFLAKRIWRHVAIQLFLMVLMFIVLPPRSFAAAAVGMTLFYASIAKKIVVSHYIRCGYVLGSSNYSPTAEPAVTPSVCNDLWAKALTECESAERQEGLWARVLAEARGDENKAMAAYTVQRVIEFADAPSPGSGIADIQRSTFRGLATTLKDLHEIRPATAGTPLQQRRARTAGPAQSWSHRPDHAGAKGHRMKMYCLRLKGYEDFSYFVMAESAQRALDAIHEHAVRNGNTDFIRPDWGKYVKSAYEPVKAFDAGQVALNSND
jgi:hypothetical protein